MKTSNQLKPTTLEQSGMPPKVKRWLAMRKKAGLKIDANSAEVKWLHGYIADPYGLYKDLSEEEKTIGREYFARSPESDIWVSFYDLSDDTRNTLWEKINAGFHEDDSLDWLFND
jgi:hypothetical protein